MSIFHRVMDRLAHYLSGGREVTLHFTADYRIARFTIPLIERLLADDEDGETYRCSIAQWTLNERPVLHVHRGVVSTLRIDGPLQDADGACFPLGGLVEAPHVTAHLDPVAARRLDFRVQEAVDRTLQDWIIEEGLSDQPHQHREINRPEADREAHAVLAQWVAEQPPKRRNTTPQYVRGHMADCVSGEPGNGLCSACWKGSDHA
jgi:hypothetical protein